MRLALAVTAAALVGCGAGTGEGTAAGSGGAGSAGNATGNGAPINFDGSGAPCAAPTGTWRLNWTARTGNCNPSFETVAVMGATTAPEGCTGTASESADHCIEQADVTCPNPDGTSFRMAGRVTINAAATAGDAIYDMTVRNANGTVQCHSTYDIQYTKQ